MSAAEKLESQFLELLGRVPVISFYAKTRGWPYVIAWAHRITGLILVVYLWFHTYTLLSLSSPGVYDASMKIYGSLFFTVLEWTLGIPVIFHALNGGRLILYEGFEMRNDGAMIRYVLGLSVVYAVLLGILMLMGSQNVSPAFYWMTMFVAALILAYGVASKFRNTRHSLLWRLQRISGVFLLVMVPAHLIFMHLSPSVGKEAGIVIERMQNGFIKFVDIVLIIAALYHAGYGVISVLRDYVSFRVFRAGLAVLVILIMVIVAWAGIRLTITV